MRADLTGTVTQTQPQYQTSELLIGALLQGYRVAEVPTVMRQRMSGESRKGRNFAYGLRYARVITQTYLRERRTSSKVPPAPAAAARRGAGAGSLPDSLQVRPFKQGTGPSSHPAELPDMLPAALTFTS